MIRLGSLLSLAIVPAVLAGRLDLIDLPVGFQPEGVTLGHGQEVYVSAFTGGSIWKGDLETGVGSVVIEGGNGTTALGIDFDRRSDYLWVCGAFSGSLAIYDTTDDFSLVAEIQLGTVGASLVNDVIIHPRSEYAYITESSQLQFYRIALDEYGRLPNGPNTVAEVIPLSSDFSFQPGEIIADQALNSNGIVITDDLSSLIIVNYQSGELFAVDPDTGKATLIDLGGDLILGGDGLVLRKNTLWVCQNRLFGTPDQGVVEVLLSEDLSCGTITRRLSNEFFNDPATALRKGNSMWTTISMWAVSGEEIATTQYQLVRVDRDSAVSECAAT
ncbi:superoxide dismutase [Ectocarpus siliculosus]|uniref:Superoxide dismutase n=1 Tax=Ectocarpus siliculosus TaxID=2880 RepID=D7G508_ECTSI|nr:superoxide dismutase [Ectocarpus siliculosus]|eukprot:CBJ33771.1 superoxide dismutase [Ectocarpus siliculosus]